MDNVQNCDSYINVLSSQTYKLYKNMFMINTKFAQNTKR
jgi:hypothetical protein